MNASAKMKLSEQEQYDEWKALPLSEKMRSDIAMASCYADEVAQLEAELEDTKKKATNKIYGLELDNERLREALIEAEQMLEMTAPNSTALDTVKDALLEGKEQDDVTG